MSEHLLEIIRAETTPFDPIPTHLETSTQGLSGIRHIAFDIYGTLIASGVGDIGNSAPADRGEALLAVLNGEGFHSGRSPESLETLFLDEIHRSQEESRRQGALKAEVEIRDVWKTFLQRVGHAEPSSDELLSTIALRFELSVNPVWPMAGMVQLLDDLRDRFAPFSIVSNAQFFTPLLFPALIGRSLPELGFEDSLCIWSYQLREAKPSPRLFEALLERLGPGYKPQEILYVGNDMLNDVSAAQKAGLKTALFAGDKRSLRLRHDHVDCRGIQPDLVLTNLANLPTLLS